MTRRSGKGERKTAHRASLHYVREVALPARELALLVAGLKRCGCTSYAQYRRRAHWRRTVSEQRKKACQKCGGRYRLCLHHITYASLGAELPEDLCTLCASCHTKVHETALGRNGLRPGPLRETASIRMDAFEPETKAKKRRRRRKSKPR